MTAVRKRLYQDRDTAELARDVSNELDSQPRRTLLRFTRVFRLPMFVPFPREPDAVLVLRIRKDSAPEEPISVLTTVSYTYTPQGIRIDALDGPDDDVAYRFTLEVVG